MNLLSNPQPLTFASFAMSAILEALRGQPVRSMTEGETILSQGGTDRVLFVLVEGAVEVIKDDVEVARCSDPGAVFGDLSVLLDIPHTASVRTTRPSTVIVVENPRVFLEQNPPACLQLCELLARRLDAVNKYLVNVKHQFEGHDHLGMVDSVLDTLMHRQPKKRIAPRDTTLRDPEVAD
jgi:CRP/FNR family transcriptional regulator, cyclic AMP receptor protein